ncbi:hypothetical protein ACJJH9_18055 [Microbulbifer sp. DLAB2-AF]|uniref:hypothetical protein n=1 Tax=Microbulbifer sp. DLAB2-AF TaxID=3243395 RepID=UPI0040399051
MEGNFSKGVLRAQRILFSTIFCIPWIASAENLTYQYDDSDRLIQASYQGEVDTDYSYDALGNILSLTSSAEDQNTPPSVPTDEIPQSGANGVSPGATTLSWSSSDANSNDFVFYDIYLGLTPSPELYKSGLKADSITISGLYSERAYYWKVVARDNHNAVIESPIWSFNTANTAPEAAPSQVNPINNLYTSYKDITLSWSKVADADPDDTVTYDIYLSESPEPALFEQGFTSTNKKLSGLDPWKTYYWKVVAIDDHGAEKSSSIWSFNPLDTDLDGTPDDIEDLRCTDKNKKDSDGDLLLDGEEDLNKNGVVDVGETNPCSADTDGDGMPDGWEVANQLDPLLNDAFSDMDGDGWSNIKEYMAGSDPSLLDSIPSEDFNLADFEDGRFDPWYWKHDGSASWLIDTENPNTGTYAIRSGSITHNQSSSTEVSVNTPDGEMFFYLSGSSENSDRLNFYIDDELKGTWFGEFPYERVIFPVTSGVHNFKWEYTKDGSRDTGSDAVWIDDIYIPGPIDEDADGIKDSWEYIYFGGLDHDMSLDSDGDGLTDEDEGLLEIDPSTRDSDSDGMPDFWEVANNLDPLVNDTLLDADEDGVSNYAEYLFGTNPQDKLDLPIEFGFEAGEFMPWYWAHSGSQGWSVDTENPYAGTYAIKSGDITHNQISSTEVSVNTPDGEIFFYLSGSSENSDRLNFYIDDELKGTWFGEFPYERVIFPVTAGVHNFKWEYTKDGSRDTGSDAVWIDDIYIPGPIDEDADGIKDSWEYIYFGGLDHDMSLDSDGDGLTDEDEGLLEIDPSTSDSDSDGMPDFWEVANNLDPLVNDTLLDADEDGVSNYAEYLFGTNPQDKLDLPIEFGFEAGAFMPWYWAHSGSQGWSVDTENPYAGTYAIKSGDITHNQISSTEVSVNTPDGEIFFYLSGSSENSDRLNFYIDDELKGTWFGEFPYERVIFPVTAGVHNFKWEYTKDGSRDTGSDAVWIDDIYIPGPIDEDADGVKDSWEYIYFGGLDHDMSLDSDGDGLTDEDEGLLEIDPSTSDSDSDGMPDFWEVANNLDPLVNDTLLDTDDDGVTNYIEYLFDTNPQDSMDQPVGFGFETGEFTPWYWMTSDNQSWTIDTEAPYAGSYAIRSGDISHSQSSSTEVSVNTPDGEMFFYLSVSSETADKLNFYIDGELKGSWSGNVPYEKVAYPITAGIHNFKWVYKKDGSVDTGSDAAWIDDIYIPGPIDEDADGIKDSWEYIYFGGLGHDLSIDSDGDGLTDEDEGLLEIDPSTSDTDADGMPDLWEVENNLDARVDDSSQDADEDGFTNYVEYVSGTNPQDNMDQPVGFGFETGEFTPWYWKNSDNQGWTIDTEAPYAGSYAIRSGDISHGQSSSTEVIVNTPSGEMLFYLSVSSETADKLNFYIDGELKGSWSGNVPYEKVVYPITAGIHNFKWVYKKDGSVDTGSDAAWIDDIYIPGPIDEDADGIKDSWEYIYFGGLGHDLSLDSDGDGLTDEDEGLLEIDPSTSDTDADGMPDLWEVNNNLDPRMNNSSQDADEDGFTNYVEYVSGTNPQDNMDQPVGFGFETGEFTPWYWKNSDNQGWTIDTEAPYAGSYAIRSGDISHGQSSSTEVIVNTPSGEMLFYLSVSSETADKLNFYIDGELKGSWSGNVPYEKVAYPITAGIHNFKWVYKKDGSVDTGSDAAWIDDIYIPGPIDEDADGIKDSWEYIYFGGLGHDLSIDSDGDGLTDEDEGLLEIDPSTSDTDADGMPDLWEVNNNLDPRMNNSSQDADEDGFTNYVEYVSGTNPQDNMDQPVGFGFETGEFTPWYWKNSDNQGWRIDTEVPYAGSYAIRSGDISHGQSSSTEVIVNTPSGEMLFYLSVSSETADKLNFYIDGELKGSWSGNVPYEKVAYPITAGIHNFKWVYKKDGSVNTGSDAAWIDDIYIPGPIDEDADGIKDSWEYIYFDGLDHDMSLDTDGDTVSDLNEYLNGTDPLN